jgi:hypothetical protein
MIQQVLHRPQGKARDSRPVPLTWIQQALAINAMSVTGEA